MTKKSDPSRDKERFCEDCEKTFTGISDQAVALGNSIRMPGDEVCPRCTRAREMLVRKMDALPNVLSVPKQIVRAKNAPREKKRRRVMEEA